MSYRNIFFKKIKIFNILNVYSESINKVGIKNYYHPFIFDNRFGKLNKLLGLWNISVSLIKYKRGVHMSRFIFILQKILLKSFNLNNFLKIYKFFIYNLESNDLFLQVSFIYFVNKYSPVSKNKSFINYKITFFLKKKNILINFIFKITLPLNSLCPCSKFISLYNSHNQRIYVTVFLFLKNVKNFNLEKLINKIESISSCQLWSLLKRNDERFITEFSYKNPKFIEDMIRNLFFVFKKKIFFLKIENVESIHNHNVFSHLKNF